MTADGLVRHPVVMVGGLLIASLHFALIYIFAALACARGFADQHVFGVGIVPAVNGILTLAAALAAIALLVSALIMPPAVAPRAADEQLLRFMRWITGAGAALSLVAIIWNGLPNMIVPACQ